MRVRNEIVPRPGKVLRVVLYARYSTDEQNPKSIADQFAECRRMLAKCGVKDAVIEEFSDEAISGETIDRPGINQVREGIKNKRWDLLVAEESSRLFRHPSECLVFVETAVDLKVRIICINDFVDTAEDDWQQVLAEAQAHHARCNKLTRFRVGRAFSSRWDGILAVTWLRPGYLRIPSKPAVGKEPAEGPFTDQIHEAHAKVVAEAFERIAAGEEPWLVVRFLNQSGLPRCDGSKVTSWNERGLFAVIRNTLYRGVEESSKTKVERKFRGAKPTQRRSNPEEIKVRQMPHLRIVSDAVWYRANAALDSRMNKPRDHRGEEHPLAGIPRDSRQPLSKTFICEICKEKMHADGRNEGGYRCSKARKGECWNRATALRSLTHMNIGGAVFAEILKQQALMEAQVERVIQLATDDAVLTARERELRFEQQRINQANERLAAAIELSDTDLTCLTQRLASNALRLKCLDGDLMDVQKLRTQQRAAPTVEEAIQAIQHSASRLLELDREAGALLGQILVGPIRAVPFQQVGSDKVVLRARLTIRVAGLLPEQLAMLKSGAAAEIIPAELLQLPLLVDLFEPPEYISCLSRCVQAKHDFPQDSLKEIGRKLGINYMAVKRSLDLARQMEAEQLTEPYRELLDCPEKASRWRGPFQDQQQPAA
jgi:hypothetical protein